MPLFDEEAGRLVLRVVYDGPAYVGKTTNISAVGEFFSVKRRSELFSSQTAANRTLYLDWLEVSGGIVDGQEMVCHFMTVPGQAALSRRRHFLLQRADVVVFIVGSDEGGLRDARSMWQEAKVLCDERKLPLLVQANKQDLPGAFSSEAIARHFDIHPRHVIAAQSNNGGGVRVTAIMAIRAAADHARRIVKEQGLSSLAGKPLTGTQLVQAMMDLEAAQPMTPMQVVLGKSAAAAAVVEGTSAAPTSGSPAHDAPVVVNPGKPPPLPTPEVPTGCIWPSSKGRDLLRQIPMATARPSIAAQGKGPGLAYAFEAGEWELRTTGSHCYENLSTAKDALLTLVRSKLSIGALLAQDTVFTLQMDAEGRYWLWCASPRLTGLSEVLNRLHEESDIAALTRELVAYADAALTVLEASYGRNAHLGLATHSFGKGELGIFHTDNEPPLDSAAVDFVRHVLLQAERFGSHADAVEQYSLHLVARLRGALQKDGLDGLELERALPSGELRSTAAQALKRRLMEVVGKRSASYERIAE